MVEERKEFGDKQRDSEEVKGEVGGTIGQQQSPIFGQYRLMRARINMIPNGAAQHNPLDASLGGAGVAAAAAV